MGLNIIWTDDQAGIAVPQNLRVDTVEAAMEVVRRKHYAGEHIVEIVDDDGRPYRVADLLGPGGL